MNKGGNTEISNLTLSNLSFEQNSFLTKTIFIQGALKNIQRFPGKIQRLFKDFPQISNFQGHDAFSRNFRGSCEPYHVLILSEMNVMVLNIMIKQLLNEAEYHLKNYRDGLGG